MERNFTRQQGCETMNKKIIMCVFLAIMGLVLVGAECTPQQTRLFSDCLGTTWWDSYYLDWCSQYDYNQDGIINLIDAGFYSNTCENSNEDDGR